MLDRIFSGSPVAVSLKTRLGLEDPEEFARLLEIFGRYPVSLLIVHPRVRKAFTGTRCGWSILSRRWMPTMGAVLQRRPGDCGGLRPVCPPFSPRWTV